MRIAIAADHAGVDLRDQLAHHLRLKGHQVDDLSPENDPEDDYPLIVEPIARAIAAGRYERGIFCCGSGIGPAVAANKIPSVRAAVVENEWSARDGVEHVNLNLLTLGERVTGVEIAKAIVDAYLGAQVQGGRHERRRKQIEDLEKVRT
ncbi:MAG TPA: RpiB/LacA/LacB family sugar-phosphate isomerase [Candidatus Limnocylindria bacterium]|nr:RpiB/LacA/LacB family sugar-phosphate isomerase [Candidatus Limnocylindria bacterium]